MEDVRSRQGRRHELASMLSLIAAAMSSGASGYKGIWIWCDELSQANRRHFHFRRYRGRRVTPSITCIRNAMIEVHPDRLQQLVNRFCIQHFDLPFEALAIDGKVLCGSKGADHRQTRIMNAIGHDSGFCHAKKKVGALPVEGSDEEKQSNEIKFFAPTLEQIDIAGRTITADAMNTQIESANHVVERGADFHFSVKGNQPGLLEDIQVWHEQEGRFQEPDFEEPLKQPIMYWTIRRPSIKTAVASALGMVQKTWPACDVLP